MASGRSARLVGRDAELGRLRALAAEAASGTARVALVRGEPGIGKTRLVAELVAELRADGVLVLTTQALQLADGALGYGVAAGLLRGLVRQVGIERVRELAGPQVGPLAVLHPALAQDAAPAAREVLFGAMDAVVAGLADEGLVCLVVDDLQWADASSRELLRFLAQSCADVALLVIVTARSTAADAAAAAQDVAALSRLPGAALVLEPLGPEAIADQLTDVLGRDPDPDQLARVQRLSEGVPLYVEELAAGAPGAGLSLGARLAGLGDDTVALLRSAAVAEGRADLALVARVAGLAPDRADAAFADAVGRGLLDPSREGAVRFHHGLLREAVLDAIEPLALRDLHAAWAEVVPEMDAGQLSRTETVTARAVHLIGAGAVDAALPAAVAAARTTRRDGAFLEAARWWEQALELWDAHPDGRRVSDLGRAEVVAALVFARQHVPRPDGLAHDREIINRALADLSRDAWVERVTYVSLLDGFDRSVGVPVSWRHDEPADVVVPRLVGELPDAAATLALQQLVLTQGEILTGEQWERLLEATRQQLAEGDAFPLVRLLTNRAFALLSAGDEAAVLAILDDIAREPALVPFAPLLMPRVCYFYATLGRPQEVMARIDTYVDVDGLGLETARLWSHSLEAYAASSYWAGAWTRCAHVCDLLVELDVDPQSTALNVGIRALVAARRGEPGQAGAVDRVLTDDDPELAPLVIRASCAVARALEVERSAGAAAAWTEMAVLLSAADLGEGLEPSYEVLVRAAQLLLRHPAAGADELALLRAAAARVEQVGRLGAAAHLEVATVIEGSATPEDWAGVAAGWDAVGPGWDAAHARLRWAQALAAAGDRAAAADVVRRALEITDALGAVPLADELRSLARSARLQVEAAEPAERPSGLTEREADVLALVGRGLTNAQIGERLYMSPKTASVHVSRLITKLGVANRTEAAAHAQRLGLVGD